MALDLLGKDFQNLITLPEQIKDLGQLTHLNLSGTRVSDINDLCDSIGLKQLDLSDTRVSDLLPLLPLTQLGKDPSGNGFNFDNTAVAKADPRIAGIADSKDRAV